MLKILVCMYNILPKTLSSPSFRPYVVIHSPKTPSGWGYVEAFACPLNFDIPFTAAIFALAVGFGCKYSRVLS